MRTFILILLLLSGHGLTAMDASAFMNEPDGFQDRKWGRTLGSLFSKDEYVGFSIDDKSAKYLVLSDKNSLEIDGVKLYGVVYSFYSGMFWKAELEARLLQAAKLLELFIKKHGEPSRVVQKSEFSTEYTWSGAVADIILLTSLNYYDRKTADIATATIYSRKMKSTIDVESDYSDVERKLNIDSIDGFRGRKWGSGFSKGVTYLPLEKEPFFEYLIKDDNMIFEGINAEEIRYRFYNNRALQKVDLYFNGRQNYLSIKEACFKLFGHTSRYENGEIKWIGNKSTVKLTLVIDINGTWLSRLSFQGFGSQ